LELVGPQQWVLLAPLVLDSLLDSLLELLLE
jgi:hypothetical protein